MGNKVHLRKLAKVLGSTSLPVHFYHSSKLAMQIELYFTLQGDLYTSQSLQEALRDISIVALLHLFLEFNDY
jgi:hypothetical protein